MVLLAAEGRPNAQVAQTVGVLRPTVIGWRDRYQAGWIAALDDQLRSGCPAEIDEIKVVVAYNASSDTPQAGHITKSQHNAKPIRSQQNYRKNSGDFHYREYLDSI
jgi:hypothetical protein